MIDTEKVLKKFVQTRQIVEQRVDYWIYSSNDFSIPEQREHAGFIKQSGACFAGLASYIGGNNNRILYRVRNNGAKKDDIVPWINLCKDYKLLPETVCPKGSEMDLEFVLDLKMPKALLYFYLCHLRYISEEIDIIRATLVLVECEVDVYASLFMASKFFGVYYGHLYLRSNNGYGKDFNLKNIKIGIHEAKTFLDFIKYAHEYDPPTEGRVVGEVAFAKCVARMKSFCYPNEEVIPLGYKDFTSSKIQAAIQSGDMEETRELYCEYIGKPFTQPKVKK